MSRYMPAFTVAAALLLAVSVGAQDTTVKSKTKIDADDAKVVTMTGCLQQAPGGELFVLTNATALKGDDMKSKSKTDVDVDDDETEVETRTKTEIEHDDDDDEAVGTSGTMRTYQLSPRAGVNLTPHVGHTVEITAVAVEAKDGDDDAEIEMETKTKVEREDAPDSKMKTKTEAELPRGAQARLTVMSVKHVSPSCGQQ